MAMYQYRRADDRAGLKSLLYTTQRRLKELEAKAAFYGASADPSLTMEIADLRLKASDLESKLQPPGQIPQDVWEAMTPDDHRRYLIALVMTLQADFSECRVKLNADVKVLCIGLVLSQIISIVLVLVLR